MTVQKYRKLRVVYCHWKRVTMFCSHQNK